MGCNNLDYYYSRRRTLTHIHSIQFNLYWLSGVLDDVILRGVSNVSYKLTKTGLNKRWIMRSDWNFTATDFTVCGADKKHTYTHSSACVNLATWLHSQPVSRWHYPVNTESHTCTQWGLEVLIFVCEGGVNNPDHMMRVTAARSQDCVYDWLTDWVADGVTGWCSNPQAFWLVSEMACWLVGPFLPLSDGRHTWCGSTRPIHLRLLSLFSRRDSVCSVVLYTLVINQIIILNYNTYYQIS